MQFNMYKRCLLQGLLATLILGIAIDCSAFSRKMTINTDSNCVAVDSMGNIYSTYLYKIEKYNKDGVLVDELDASASAVGYNNYAAFYGIAVAPDDSLYVSTGSAQSGACIRKYSSDFSLLLEFGSSGNGDGQFDNDAHVAIDPSGNVFVADIGNNRIQKFDANGNFLKKWGEYGSEDNQFLYMRSLSIDESGNIYVADGNSSGTKMQKFTNSGTFVYAWRRATWINTGLVEAIKGNFIVRAPDGSFLMAGSNWFAKYSANKTLLDYRIFEDMSYGTTKPPHIAADGLIYAPGSSHLFVYDWNLQARHGAVPVVNTLLLD